MKTLLASLAVFGVLLSSCGKNCSSNEVCAHTSAKGDFCTTHCNGIDGGGCPAGQTCTGAAPCCGPGQACPAIELFVCQ